MRLGLILVPIWNLLKNAREKVGSILAPSFLLVPIWASGFFLYGLFLLPVMTTWVGVLVDEGYTHHAAQRFLSGQWPYRDFFFLWSPGVIFLHGAAQVYFPSWEKLLPLLVTTLNGAILLWIFCREFSNGTKAALGLALLLFLWNFPLWNVTYSSWFALTPVLLGGLLGPHRAFALGICLGAAFWWKQNMGLLPLGLVGLYFLCSKQFRAGLLLFFGSTLAIVLPFLALSFLAGPNWWGPALSQMLLFPFTYREQMALPLSPTALGPWLTIFGFWLAGCLYRGPHRVFLLAALVFLTFFQLSEQGLDLGVDSSFKLFSLMAWIGPFFIWRDLSSRMKVFFFISFGAFLQVYPRFDFQHFLFSFPLAAYWIVFVLSQLQKQIDSSLPAYWLALPVFCLSALGIVKNGEVVSLRYLGQQDSLGFISFGYAHRVANEFAEVKQYLEERGQRPGDPVLVLPNATKFYSWSGFRNVTPYDQFFPSYVESFGGRQLDVLPLFESKGGKWVLSSPGAGLEKFAPVLDRHLQVRYRVVKAWPNMWSLWERKPPPAELDGRKNGRQQ